MARPIGELNTVGRAGRRRPAGCGLGAVTEPFKVDALAVQRERVVHRCPFQVLDILMSKHSTTDVSTSRDSIWSYTGQMDEQDSVDVCIGDVTARYAAIDAEVEGVVDRVARIGKQLSRIFDETLSGHGLSLGEYTLMLRLRTRSEDNRMSAGDLSRALLLSSGAMTNRLDRLETAGLVRRVPDPRDRRGVLVELTARGEKQIDKAVTEQAAKEIDVLRVLSASELTELNLLLRKVLVSLETPAEQTRAG